MRIKFNKKQEKELRRIINGLRKAYEKRIDSCYCEFEGYKMYPVPSECSEPREIADFLEFLLSKEVNEW